MTEKTIIEKALKGGWKQDYYVGKELNSNEIKEVADIHLEHYGIYQVLLDPKFWQAVQRSEGCKTHSCWFENKGDLCSRENKVAVHKMHEMIDALVEGKSIEEYLKTL